MNYIICFPPNSKKLGDEIICKNVNSYPAGPSSDPSDDTRTFSQFLASFYTKNSVYTKEKFTKNQEKQPGIHRTSTFTISAGGPVCPTEPEKRINKI
jgi:hypothetical protein